MMDVDLNRKIHARIFEEARLLKVSTPPFLGGTLEYPGG